MPSTPTTAKPVSAPAVSARLNRLGFMMLRNSGRNNEGIQVSPYLVASALVTVHTRNTDAGRAEGAEIAGQAAEALRAAGYTVHHTAGDTSVTVSPAA